MAESTEVWPAYYYSPQVLAGRVFASEQEVTAASSEGPWTRSLTEAQAAGTPTPPPAPRPTPNPTPDEDDDPPARRSHR
jgi:hypothetical protein